MNHRGSPPAAFGPRMSVLKRVHQLVAEDVVGVSQAGRHRHDHPAFGALGDAPGAFAELALDDIGLLEVGVTRVQDHRLAADERVPEDSAEPGVPSLGHPPDLLRGVGLFRVVINVEVLGGEDLEFEFVVLDLVPSEVLRVRLCGQTEGHRDREDEAGCEAASRQRLQHGELRFTGTDLAESASVVPTPVPPASAGNRDAPRCRAGWEGHSDLPGKARKAKSPKAKRLKACQKEQARACFRASRCSF